MSRLRSTINMCRAKVTHFPITTAASTTFTRRHSTRPRQFTLSLSNNTTKQQVLDTLRKTQTDATAQISPDHDGLVLLTTPSLASWLEDEAFMSAAISSISGARASDSADLGVVSAVVDGLFSPDAPSGVSGFSVLSGSLASLVPGLTYATSRPPTRDAADTPGALSFSFRADAGSDTRRVTLSLSNTIFQNGRQSTLFTSRWSAKDSQPPKLVEIASKWALEINYPHTTTPATISYSVPLVPITPPRPILSSFGNIVRQVEVGGKAVPASDELETIIPKMVAARGPHAASGPMAIWALAIPPGIGDTGLPRADSFDPTNELQLVQRSSPILSDLLNAGCRLHQLLSGGGGWGSKKGLLALDPEVRFGSSGHDEGEMMMMQLLESPSNRQSGIIRPGWSIQFLATPFEYSPIDWDGHTQKSTSKTTIFGIKQPAEGDSQDTGDETIIKWLPGQFGGLAKQIFVEAGPDDQAHSKINVPHALLRI